MGQTPTTLFNLHSNPNEVAIVSPHFTDEISGPGFPSDFMAT